MALNLDYDLMDGVADKMDPEVGTLEQLVTNLNNCVAELRTVWDSPAAQQFEEEWNTVQPKLVDLHTEFLPTIIKNIRTAAENYRQAEEANKGSAG